MSLLRPYWAIAAVAMCAVGVEAGEEPDPAVEVGKWIKVLKEGDEKERCGAVGMLGHLALSSPEVAGRAVPHLVAALNDKSAFFRSEAAVGLGMVAENQPAKAKSAIRPLAAARLEDKSAKVRSCAALAESFAGSRRRRTS